MFARKRRSAPRVRRVRAAPTALFACRRSKREVGRWSPHRHASRMPGNAQAPRRAPARPRARRRGQTRRNDCWAGLAHRPLAAASALALPRPGGTNRRRRPAHHARSMSHGARWPSSTSFTSARARSSTLASPWRQRTSELALNNLLSARPARARGVGTRARYLLNFGCSSISPRRAGAAPSCALPARHGPHAGGGL